MASKIQVDKISRNSGTPEFTVPTADGTSGQFIKTDGSGVLSFGSGVALTGSTNNMIPTVTGANALAGEANLTYDGNTLDIKNAGTASSLKLYCESSNAHYTEIKSGPHSGATQYTLTLPNKPPTANGQALTATTAGVASWATSSLAPAFSVCANAVTGITAATATKIVLDREVFDTSSAFDTTTYRFTVPAGEGGKYFISAAINFLMTSSSTTSNIQCMLYLNGSEHGNTDSVITNQSNITNLALNGSWVLDLAAADYIELFGYISGSGTQYNGHATLQKTHMTGFKLLGV